MHARLRFHLFKTQNSGSGVSILLHIINDQEGLLATPVSAR
jgi:hypothetical protein